MCSLKGADAGTHVLQVTLQSGPVGMREGQRLARLQKVVSLPAVSHAVIEIKVLKLVYFADLNKMK